MINRCSSAIVFSCILLSILFIYCNNPVKKIEINPPLSANKLLQPQAIKGAFSAQTKIKFDSNNVNIFLQNFPKFKDNGKEISNFYKDRKYAFAWYDDKGIIEPASNLYNRIMNISDEGISAELPYKEAFINLMDSAVETIGVQPTIELMLTAQYLAYAKKVWQGVSEKQSLSIDWLMARKKISSQQLLDSLVNGKSILENEPVYRQYNLLKNYLKKYHAIAKNNEFSIIKADQKLYKLKDNSPTISAIRERLFLLEDLAENSKSNIFDTSLLLGIKSFERRIGRKEDGILNSALLAEINYPIEKRITQLIVNMERSRWVPTQPQGNYIVINIPEYKLYVYEQDSIAFSMNVVVGKNEHRTVIFNGHIKYIVFSPYWNIPVSIINKEILPGIKKNPSYLEQHNMEWNNGNIRQKPGPNNSLGLVKFLFPNSHSIYLHDSPAKSLFKESDRAFSHGCIRLAEPKKLATYLLRNNTVWKNAQITNAMNIHNEQYVTLKETVPVFITYFTAWVDRQQKLQFRKDVYQRDSRLAQMIIEKPGI